MLARIIMSDDKEASSSRLTHDQLVEIALSDPAPRARLAENPLVARRRQLYADASAGVRTDLAAAGFPIAERVGELRQPGRPVYKAAVPVLLEWLPKVIYLGVVEDIVRTLSVPFARSQALPGFLDMFPESP